MTPFQTIIKGSVTYTIPKVDVLVSTVFQSLPGAEHDGEPDLQQGPDHLECRRAPHAPRSRAPSRPTASGASSAPRRVPFGVTTATTVPVQLLLSNEFCGERVTTFDVKIAKNIRFSGRRLNVGVDVYNFFNSDAITMYNAHVHDRQPGDAGRGSEQLAQPTGLVSPRFVRLQIQFDF